MGSDPGSRPQDADWAVEFHLGVVGDASDIRPVLAEVRRICEQLNPVSYLGVAWRFDTQLTNLRIGKLYVILRSQDAAMLKLTGELSIHRLQDVM